MATTKIWKVVKRLDHVVDYAKNENKTKNDYLENGFDKYEDIRQVVMYATNSDKTEKQFYTTGINCDVNKAVEQMQFVKKRYGKEKGILAFHAEQSFKERLEYYKTTYPDFKFVLDELNIERSKLAKLILGANIEKKELQKENLKSIEYELEQIMVKNDIPNDVLDIKYYCDNCKDTGVDNRSGERCFCYEDVRKEALDLSTIPVHD